MTLKEILENYNSEYFGNEDDPMDGFKMAIDKDAEERPHFRGFGLGAVKSQREVDWEQNKEQEKIKQEAFKKHHEEVKENVRKKMKSYKEQLKEEGDEIKAGVDFIMALRYVLTGKGDHEEPMPVLDWYAQNHFRDIINRADAIVAYHSKYEQQIKDIEAEKLKLKKEAAAHYSIYLTDEKEDLVKILKDENTEFGLRSIIEGLFYCDKKIRHAKQNLERANDEWKFLHEHYEKFASHFIEEE